MLLLSGGFDRNLKVLDFNLAENPGQLVSPVKEMSGHSSWISCILSLEDEQNFVSADDYGELIVWELFSGKQLYRLSF